MKTIDFKNKPNALLHQPYTNNPDDPRKNIKMWA